jgi:hypothetical protein
MHELPAEVRSEECRVNDLEEIINHDHKRCTDPHESNYVAEPSIGRESAMPTLDG